MVDKDLRERGMTLIELILSIALMGIVLVLITTIFSTAFSIYEDIYSYTEIQQQGHLIMDFISEQAIHSKQISYIRSDNELFDSGVEVSEFGLKDSNLSEKENHIFSIQRDVKAEGNSLRYGRQSPVTIEVGNYIDKIYLKTLPEKTEIDDARGFKITLIMKKRGKTFEIFKKIYFRN